MESEDAVRLRETGAMGKRLVGQSVIHVGRVCQERMDRAFFTRFVKASGIIRFIGVIFAHFCREYINKIYA